MHFPARIAAARRPAPPHCRIGTFNHPVDDPAGLAFCRPMSDTLPPTGTAALDRVFAALAHPVRRAILTMLLEDDMAVTDVAAPFAMSLAAVSKHLTVLAEAGLILQERRGRVIWCKLEPETLREAAAWMKGFGLLEAIDLDAFERFLARELGSDDAGEPQHGAEDDDGSDEADDAARGERSPAVPEAAAPPAPGSSSRRRR
jgi:DNA-binding transcriptional ArsR family regulator